jgi:AcrR family transcriptional regulator
MRKTKKAITKKLLGREDWLIRSLEVIAKKGGRFRIEEFARELGVTKGSFYWHFRGRPDFVLAVVEYWADYFTTRVTREVTAVRGDTRDRLRAVMDIVTREELGKYDVAFLSWAAHSPDIARVVKKVFKTRMDFVGALFAEMGFTGVEHEMRTRSFVSYMLAQDSDIFPHESKKERVRKLRERFAFFVRP